MIRTIRANVIPVSGSAAGSTSNPTTTSATYVQIPEMSVTVTSQGGSLLCIFQGSFNTQAGDDFTVAIFVDGTEVTASDQRMSFNGGTGLLGSPAQIVSGPGHCFALSPQTAGSHTITVRWKVAAGTARAVTTQRQLVVTEVL